MTTDQREGFEAPAEPLKGWKLNHVQFERGSGTAQIGYLDPEGDHFSPIVTVDTGLYYQPDVAMPLASAILAALAAAPAQPAEPMDWPLPCDVKVGHGTMRKGVPLRTLVARMKVLYEMATGEKADKVANLTPAERDARMEQFRADLAAGCRPVARDATPPSAPAQQACQPASTECPRCKNRVGDCPLAAPAQAGEPTPLTSTGFFINVHEGTELPPHYIETKLEDAESFTLFTLVPMAAVASIAAQAGELAVWIDPSDLAELQTKENSGIPLNRVLCTKPFGRLKQPLYTAPTKSAEPLSFAQRRRLWLNSPEVHPDAKSYAAFERILQLVERAHGIPSPTGGEKA